MKKLVVIVSFLLPILIQAQTEHAGIKFEHGQRWKSIIAQAKAAHKYVFADCYTTWCGPCKYMATKVFTNDTIGQFFNEHFVCAKVQIDSSKEDNDAVKSFYADAAAINKQYKIRVYPTYLIFSPEGELVHKFIGAMDVAEFLAKGQECINPATQYYVLQKKFSKSLKDSAFLRKLTMAAWAVEEDCSKYFKAYSATQSSMFTKDNAELIKKVTGKTTDTGFTMVLNHIEEYDRVMEKGKANSLIVSVVVYEELKKIQKSGIMEINKTLEDRILKAYPNQSKQILLNMKVNIYTYTKDWKKLESVITEYMKDFGDLVTDEGQLNEYAWNVFDHIDSKETIEAALGWSKRAISDKYSKESAMIDTYANLLYKIGRTQEAIEAETKSMEYAPASEKASYQETIDKMKKGEKTWTE